MLDAVVKITAKEGPKAVRPAAARAARAGGASPRSSSRPRAEMPPSTFFPIRSFSLPVRPSSSAASGRASWASSRTPGATWVRPAPRPAP